MVRTTMTTDGVNYLTGTIREGKVNRPDGLFVGREGRIERVRADALQRSGSRRPRGSDPDVGCAEGNRDADTQPCAGRPRARRLRWKSDALTIPAPPGAPSDARGLRRPHLGAHLRR
jgi:hypothetical protein